MSKAVLPLLGYDLFIFMQTQFEKNVDREYHFYVANCYKYEWNLDYFALTTDGRNLTKFRPRRNYVNRIERRSVLVWNVNEICKNFCNRLIYIWSASYMHITSNINTFGKRNTLEGRWSGKCQNFNWIMDALASWNCRLQLHSFSGRAWHWNWFVYTILRYFSKEQTSNLQSHCFTLYVTR
jgi:hypothetical protein